MSDALCFTLYSDEGLIHLWSLYEDMDLQPPTDLVAIMTERGIIVAEEDEDDEVPDLGRGDGDSQVLRTDCEPVRSTQLDSVSRVEEARGPQLLLLPF